jgi:transcriptional regulator with XRE-family HTH domain
MPRWRKPTKEEIRARRSEIAELARTGRLELPGAVVAMRRALGMSQEQFANLFRLTRRQLAEIERGESNPTVATLERIGKAFGFRVGFVPSSGGGAVSSSRKALEPAKSPAAAAAARRPP